jgi:hypothetical protein
MMELPEELILYMVCNLKAIRSEEPQSQAFKNPSRERARQRENRLRQATLHSLCLSCHKLCRIATPVLYSSFVGSTTLYGVRLLNVFFATLSTRQELGLHVEYVENRLSDYLGHALHNDLKNFPNSAGFVADYFVKLAIVVRLSPNIQYLCTVSIESIDETLWSHILPDSTLRWTIADHGFPKLHTLVLQTNTTSELASVSDRGSFSTIFYEMVAAPRLTCVRALGAIFERPFTVWRPFSNLQQIELTEATSDLNAIDQLLCACDDLTRFTCQWQHLSLPSGQSSVDLLPGIVKHKRTLETLWLIPSRIYWSDIDPISISFSSLSHLTTLKEAKLMNLVILDGATHVPVPLSSLIPQSLEHLTVLHHIIWSNAQVYGLKVLQALWDLAYDCTRQLPNLRELIVQHELSYLSELDKAIIESLGGIGVLEAGFHDHGVKFELMDELGMFS